MSSVAVRADPSHAPRPATATPARTEQSASRPGWQGAPAQRLPGGAQGGGEPLAMPLRRRLEASFRADLSGVRLHTGAEAEGAAAQAGTRAFAYGENVYLGRGVAKDDAGVIAHEVAHVLQQRGGAASTQRAGGGHGESPALEAEAQQASRTVLAGGAYTVSGRTTGLAVQGLWGIGDIIGRARSWLAGRAHSIPGYRLLTVVIGYDPIAGERVERNANNLLEGLAGLIPGGVELYRHLRQSGILSRAYDWVVAELSAVGLTLSAILELVMAFLRSLSASDIFRLGSVFSRIGRLIANVWQRVVSFVGRIVPKLLEFIVEGVLNLVGASGFMAHLRRIGSALAILARDPIGFLRNLINAVKAGLFNFARNILGHLRTALFEWLFGALAGAGIRLPAQWDFRGVVSVVLQVLGLTYVRLRQRLVRLIGEPPVRFIEGAFEFLRILLTQGLSAAWQRILEFAANLRDMVIAGIRDWVVTRIVQAGITRLATMFNPVGAIINAIIAIYNTVMFFIERARQIAAVGAAIADSLATIAAGNIAAAAAAVERTLARLLTVAISFLARFLGLGNVSAHLRRLIQRVHGVVDRALDRVVEWVRRRVGPMLGRQAATTMPARGFAAAGESHRVTIALSGGRPEVVIRSAPRQLLSFIADAETSGKIPRDRRPHLARARTLYGQLDAKLREVASGRFDGAALETRRAQAIALEGQLADALRQALDGVALARFDQRYRLEGLVGTYAGMPRQTGDRLTPDHQPQAALYKHAAGMAIFRGTRMTQVARGHANGALAINLHHNRHVAGRTYGRGANTTQVDTAAAGARTDTAKRRAVIGVLRRELGADVTAMRSVIARPANSPVWADIRALGMAPRDETQLIGNIRRQVNAGEGRIAGQNLDALGES